MLVRMAEAFHFYLTLSITGTSVIQRYVINAVPYNPRGGAARSGGVSPLGRWRKAPEGSRLRLSNKPLPYKSSAAFAVCGISNTRVERHPLQTFCNVIVRFGAS